MIPAQPAADAPAASAKESPAPALSRRLACFLYEGALLFGVVMAAGFAYAVLTRQQHALVGTTGLQALLFVVLGIYFAGCWSRGGQTLAMQTWHVRVVMTSGQRLSLARALCRYLLAWLWFVPALLGVRLAGLKEPLPIFSAMIAGMAAYAALTWLRPDRQYWHDAVCGTRLVAARPDTRP